MTNQTLIIAILIQGNNQKYKLTRLAKHIRQRGITQKSKQKRKPVKRNQGVKVSAKKRSRGIEIVWKDDGLRKQKRKINMTEFSGLNCISSFYNHYFRKLYIFHKTLRAE